MCHKAHIVWDPRALNAPLCTLEAALSEGCRQQPGGDPAFPAPPGISLCPSTSQPRWCFGRGRSSPPTSFGPRCHRQLPSLERSGTARDAAGARGSLGGSVPRCPKTPWCCTFVTLSLDCFVSCVSSPGRSRAGPPLAPTAPRKNQWELQHWVLARPPPGKPEPQTTFHFTSNDLLFFWFQFLLL